MDGSLAPLLDPFEEPQPAGEDVRSDASPQSLYYRLRDARSEARAAERAADDDPEFGGALPSQWAQVQALATEILRTRGKDVEVGCWLTESLTRLGGLAGLADGAELLAGLIDGFWSQGLFPVDEEDDPEARLAAITGLSGQDRDGSLLQQLRKTVLFERPDGMPVTLWDYERSASLSASGTAPDTKSAAAVVPFSEIEAEARGSGLAALRVLDGEIARAASGWGRLEDAIARVVPTQAQPSTGRVRSVLDALRRTTARYVPEEAPHRPGLAETASSDVEPDGSHSQAPAARPDAGQSAEAGRDVLLDQILRIAALFRVNEPNSPIGFTLEEAVRRARLAWPDLLRELVPDPAARSVVTTSVGMRLTEPSSAASPE
ncbi:type VI secretion system protein ImpA [Methylobacterium sp. OAE515]|uniref:type VI secretion system protein TssA n=1 Tax=Methylobacterium sp. OAE515 TaxID=2817895 RepID=UPI0017899506